MVNGNSFNFLITSGIVLGALMGALLGFLSLQFARRNPNRTPALWAVNGRNLGRRFFLWLLFFCHGDVICVD